MERLGKRKASVTRVGEGDDLVGLLLPWASGEQCRPSKGAGPGCKGACGVDITRDRSP